MLVRDKIDNYAVTLIPLSDDPKYAGLYLVTTFEAFFEGFSNQEKDEMEKAS
jgi:hypothetical protein